jgi:molybdopterin synthase catalytic subunit
VYQKSKVNFGKIYSDFLTSLGENTGAATTFLGVARRESADGTKKIRALVMESYADHANRALSEICDSIKNKFKLNGAIIVHALGSFRPGEPVVMVAVSSPRRDASFYALSEAVERYKKEPAIFKKEIYVDGTSAWIC